MQITTAAGITAMVDLFFDGKLGKGGFIRQEMCPCRRSWRTGSGGIT
ncbi:unnamed protein product, partial [Phaeothamnion confervicola]